MTMQKTKLTDVNKNTLDDEIAQFPPAEDLQETDTQFIAFESREDAYRKVWDALVSKDKDGPTLVGIYGTAGVGKTRMVQNIFTEAEHKGIFDKVIWVDVGRANEDSNWFDPIKIQNQIAGYLNFQFVSQYDKRDRASELSKSLEDGGKLLIVLDDIWETISLYDIGIRLSSPDCKILLISRVLYYICKYETCTHLVMLEPLTVDESRALFNETVGYDKIASLQSNYRLQDNIWVEVQDSNWLAKEVCDNCGGLPLIIHSVGKSLKSKPRDLWIEAFSPLEIGKIESVPGIGPDVYTCLIQSFGCLPSRREIKCMMLCSLFPEGADIPIRFLIFLATITDAYTFEGRSQVLKAVDGLMSSLMLVEAKDDQHIKLHPIFRGVARSRAVKKGKTHLYLFVRCGSQLPDSADYGAKDILHLYLDRNDFIFPNNLSCHTMFIRSVSTLKHQFFFQEMDRSYMFSNLQLLVLTNFYCKKQFSLGQLSNLPTIMLDHCDLFETEVTFFPENIEALYMWDCHLPERLHLPDLKRLLKLEILGGISDVVFVQNSISGLTSLQELHIANRLLIIDDNGILVPILDEFINLSGLISLHICINQCQAFRGTTIFDHLREFNICVGRPRDCKHNPGASSKRLVELSGNQLEAFKGLVESAEEVTLRNTNFRLSSIWNSSRQEFVCWRNLYIEECDTMEYVAKMSHDEIKRCIAKVSSCYFEPLTTFSEVTILEIKQCSAIKYLFCNNAAKFFGNLLELCITDCPMMEAIIMNEDTNEVTGEKDFICFSQLKSLKLCNMPRLTSFYKQNKYMHSGSTSTTDNSNQSLFDEMVRLPGLEVLELSSLEDTTVIWSKYYLEGYSSDSFCELKRLIISKCNRLEIVIPLAMLHRLRKLEVLHIIDCSSLVSEVGTYDDYTQMCQLKTLSQMHLENLPCLANTGLSSRDHSKAINLYPRLHSLYIKGCSSLTNVFQPSTARVLVGLKELHVSNCEMMKEIVGAGEDEENTNGVMFPELTLLQLSHLPRLTSFWCSQSVEADACKIGTESRDHSAAINLYPNLHSLNISDCSSLTNVFRACTARALVHLKEIRVSNCKVMSEIIEAAGGEEIIDSITFPELTVLQLSLLPNLTRFWCSSGGETDTYKVAFPNLVDLELNAREFNLEAIEFGSDIDSTWLLTSLSISLSCDKELQLPHTWLHRLNNLKTLQLRPYWLQHLSFHGLNVLRVFGYGCSVLFTFSVFSYLGSLQELEISNCALLEEIAGDESSDEFYWNLQLRSLILRDLPKLKFIFHNPLCRMPDLEVVQVINCGLSTLFSFGFFKHLKQLRNLQVSDCRLLQSIVQDSRDNETSYTDDTDITLYELSYVVLRDLPKFKSFAHSAKFECQMPNLVEVQVDKCGLSTLFTSNVFKSLQNLRKLEVSNCRVLEDIVEDSRINLTFSTNERNIKLSRLSEIVLENLPNLESFSPSARYDFNMSALYTFRLVGCPRLEKFTSLKTATGLVYVYIEGKCWEEVQDLNEYIRQKRKGGSNSKDTAGKSSSSNQKLYNEAVRVEELDLYLT